MSASRRNPVLTLATRLIADQLLPRIDHAAEASRLPFRQADILRPHPGSRRWGWTHYGVFLPQLPEPFRYCNLMTMIGASGTVLFDNDHLVTTTARDTATLLSSTALGDRHLYHAYSVLRDCDLRPDGSLLRFGDDLEIKGAWPHYHVRAAWEDFRLEIDVECSDTVSWFVRNPAYDHCSLLSTCSGTLRQGSKSITLERTLCTFEYARCVSPQVLLQRPLPEALKVPADFFCYNIVNIDAGTQLLLTDVRAAGRTAFKGVHERNLAGQANVFVEDVSFTVEEYAPEPAVDPQGRAMRLPRVFTWTVRDYGERLLDLTCTVDAPWRWGHGRGYAGAYRYEGRYRGRPIRGTGYIEYVDCEGDPS